MGFISLIGYINKVASEFVLGEIIDNSLTDEKLSNANGNIKDTVSNIENRIGWMDEFFSGIKFVAHRGYSSLYPENTLKSYVESDRVGFLAWELDPALTVDGTWVNMHDDTVDRTTNGTGDINTLTLSYVKSLTIDGGNNASLFKGMTVPTIDEVFSLAYRMKEKPVLFLNNRNATPVDGADTTSLSNIIKKYNYEKKTIIFTSISNFEGMRKVLPSVGVCADFGTFEPTDEELDTLKSYTPNAMASISYTVLLGVNGTSVVEKCKNRGILIQAHTVNSHSDVIKLKALGVNTILTDVCLNY